MKHLDGEQLEAERLENKHLPAINKTRIQHKLNVNAEEAANKLLKEDPSHRFKRST